MIIFSGSSNKHLAESTAGGMGVNFGHLEIFVFPDGERRVRVIDKVVDENTVVFQSTSTPPDQNYMELFFIVDALKRSGAKSVTAVVSYLGYERQDHVFRDGEAVSLEVIIETLERVGVDKLVAFDLHSVKVPELFSIPVLHLSALPLFAEKIKNEFKDEIILVSPDMGGIRRIKELSESLGNTPFATIVKNRDLETGRISDSQLNGDVRGKISIIVDDMIATGDTTVDAARLLLENGATKVFAFATHAVFTNKAPEVLQKSGIEKVWVTDTINIPQEKKFPKLEIISVSKAIAEGLKNF
ncbi:MAG: ribose-phosphate pyrophosphokinase [Patescibacteria group bacterium]|nr:ribose-phosphate pyrophosphokinase [Patescibacteria group bacterium]